MPTTSPSGSSGARALLLVLVAGGAWLGCRDTDQFMPEPLRPDLGGRGETWQLTYNLGDDRSPAWSPGGDSVYYSAEGFAGFPDAPGILLAVPREGGGATPLVPEQTSAARTRWLTAPDAGPAGDRLAFTEIPYLSDPLPCVAAFNNCGVGAERRVPPLLFAGVWVHELAGAPLPEQPPLLVELEGRTFVSEGPPTRLELRWHPFQKVYQQERTPVFRASWAADGSRLVFSDGLRLLVWSAGGTAPSPIPGTADGISAAWSPSGAWIAFTRLLRGDSVTTACTFSSPLGTVCRDERTDYALLGSVVTLVRPDGSEARELHEGADPAWSHDGATVYFRYEDALWRQSVNGGVAQRLPGSERGREPAPSPDGRYLAFARETRPGNHDIWVLSLELP